MLIICPTPIGNLEDATPRQKKALAEADLLACEDTRRTGKLLELFGISRADGKPRLLSFHEHNEAGRIDEILAALSAGDTVVLASDAGTPTISDPGYRLVHEAAQAGHEVVPLPGPVAATVALSGSGLPTDRFFFEGFVPTRTKARQERLEALKPLGVTVIIYESPHRIVELLEDVEQVFGPDHQVCAARELTKMHEEFLRGSAAEVRTELASREIHGEFVLLLGPYEPDISEDDIDRAIDDKIAELLEQGMRPRGIKEVVAELFDVRKSELYDRIERVRDSRD